ncbi:2,3-dihydro-2,3-dihydroxybenzoate dehydrogenase [Bacillus cytotoxicus]|uniref:2,3-dihydro-2,3-dihydroxybenzoate dehydrogenase n=1 Tax=Bacillus cytotoxicus (strain DSM 22905 / CIP 110041 / 391-98 / NVH 391-98) TaxID=315749 RepID=A7GPJ6_BACCN|nr:2,3-dihydro-2,3-dihydroxybenzoate dehydrogenase [Bacillus cytotoxicus]ABS22054.1 short-chain dehydrogenase/reductase SDR [Bacillus cytotoxicus NVH 391-98]AWC44735.1 2,3-dihydro-2,3-dihydroxybenzoate dehydrogenase [Bacillus cytotoxicus]MDH2864250.1 2,3-dihydro-2,3-dihydroxybenzoate dehydrogenase [Bacillus cytotoxicus]MDH2880390.1 2,3-dihydro-2,3-dihydroxybenzoate dehydrogenase [Bacillus cytotoxicus]MDH2885218.1 2,3-dihydro-2,3-dihydroxybenzoate dehydrogenase [Bacillus cytotoxicus]
MSCNEFKGKIALVTGAAQGIGKTVASMLAERGAEVAAVDTNLSALQLLSHSHELEGTILKAFQLDVSNCAAVERVVDQIENEMGSIDILVNVAGILRMGQIPSFSDEDWDATFSVNSTGVFYISRAVSKRMMGRKSGVIVTVGSNAANIPRIGMAAYAASKAAVTMFTKCLGLELAEYNIRCNVVSPGSTETEMQRQLWTDKNGPERIIAGSQDTYRLGIPLQKIATPVEIAEGVLFLASDKASHITMHNLCIDGGATLGV